MKSEYLTEYDEKYYILVPVPSRQYEKALVKGDEIVNDLLSALSIADRDTSLKDSPITKRAMKAISKNLWRMLK